MELDIDLTKPISDFIDALVPTEFDPFSVSYLKQEAFAKFCNASKESQDERKAATIDKFLSYEKELSVVNRNGFPLHIGWFLEGVTRRIAMVLEGIDWGKEIQSMFRLPSGATTTHKRDKCHPYLKLMLGQKRQMAWQVTPRLQMYLWTFLEGTITRDYRRILELTDGDIFFTVPKNSKIDRGCGKGPIGNLIIQLIIGRILRRALKRVGVDLDYGHRTNAALARAGSITNLLATVDLTNASGLIAHSFVSAVMPRDAYHALAISRSDFIDIDGLKHEYEHWSPMGNGYTFELQSLIFYCAACTVRDQHEFLSGRACRDRRVTTFGDDIIMPVEAVPLFFDVCDAVGWKPNESKTFYDGPFRESCGKHWYNGVDVSPFYIRGPVDNLRALILYLNNLRKWGTRCGSVADPRIGEHWLQLKRQYVPKPLWGGMDIDTDESLFSLPFCSGKRLAFDKQKVKRKLKAKDGQKGKTVSVNRCVNTRNMTRLRYSLLCGASVGPDEDHHSQYLRRASFRYMRSGFLRLNDAEPWFRSSLDSRFVTDAPNDRIFWVDPHVERLVDRPARHVGPVHHGRFHFELGN